MFYQDLISVAKYFTEKDHDIDEILQMFCLREIAELRFIASYFFTVERDGRLHLHSFYGARPDEIGLVGDSVEMTDNAPFVTCIRDGRLLWTSRIQNIKQNSAGRFKSVMAWPISSEYRVMGSFFAISESPYRDDPELRECVEALAALVNLAIAKNLSLPQPSPSRALSNGNSDHYIEQVPHLDGQLSDRQELILKMIAEGRTNGDIADILGYSESLIRQETIRIYAALKCSGRTEAARLYRQRSQERALIENP